MMFSFNYRYVWAYDTNVWYVPAVGWRTRQSSISLKYVKLKI